MSSVGGPNMIAARRCFNHAQRDAIARCPSCGRFYCRECVVDYEGRMTCQTCLDAVATKPASRSNAGLQRILGTFYLVASILMVWSVFYLATKLGSSIPESFHRNPADYFLNSEFGEP